MSKIMNAESLKRLLTIIIIIIINLTPFELKAMRVSYKGLKLGKTLLFT